MTADGDVRQLVRDLTRQPVELDGARLVCVYCHALTESENGIQAEGWHLAGCPWVRARRWLDEMEQQ